MSAEALTWARMQKVGNSTRKHVLEEIANWTNGCGEACFRKIGQLADIVEVSERQVQRCLQILERDGWIVRIPRMRDDGKGQTSNAFEIPRFRAWLEASKRLSDSINQCHPGGDISVTPENRDIDISSARACEEPRHPRHVDLPDGVSETEWDAYGAMRARIGNPIEGEAEEAIIRRTLIKLARDGHDAAEVLRHAIRRQRAWLEPPKSQAANAPRKRLPERPKRSAGGAKPIRLSHPDESGECAQARKAIASSIGSNRYRYYMDPARVSINGQDLCIATTAIGYDELAEESILAGICRAVHQALPHVATIRLEGVSRLPKVKRYG